jgi:hypothetical protein
LVDLDNGATDMQVDEEEQRLVSEAMALSMELEPLMGQPQDQATSNATPPQDTSGKQPHPSGGSKKEE